MGRYHNIVVGRLILKMMNRRHLKIWIFTAALLILIVTLLQLREHPGKTVAGFRRKEDNENI